MTEPIAMWVTPDARIHSTKSDAEAWHATYKLRALIEMATGGTEGRDHCAPPRNMDTWALSRALVARNPGLAEALIQVIEAHLSNKDG